MLSFRPAFSCLPLWMARRINWNDDCDVHQYQYELCSSKEFPDECWQIWHKIWQRNMTKKKDKLTNSDCKWIWQIASDQARVVHHGSSPQAEPWSHSRGGGGRATCGGDKSKTVPVVPVVPVNTVTTQVTQGHRPYPATWVHWSRSGRW